MYARALVRTAIFSAVASAVAVGFKRFMDKRVNAPRPAGAAAGVREGEGPIRNAGPEALRTAAGSKRWEKEDEASDESFPASDPPGQGVG